MRMVFILMFLVNVAVTLVSLAVLPARVAIHFGADGVADGWGTNTANAIFMTAIHVFLFSTMYFSPRLVLRKCHPTFRRCS